MAYKNIHEKFWTDRELRRLSLEEKYLFFYLITNPHSHFSGIYYLPMVSISEETGMPKKQVITSIKRLSNGADNRDRVSGGYQEGSQKVSGEYREGSQKVSEGYQEGSQKVSGEYQEGRRGCFLLYDEEYKIVWVRNCLRYQLVGRFSPQQMKAVESHLATLQPSNLIKLFLDYYKYRFGVTFFYQDAYPISTFSKKTAESVSESVSEDRISISKQNIVSVDKFEEWWNMYPDRNGKKLEKQESLKRFLKIPEGEIPSLLIATQNYAGSEMVKKGVGVKDPKRFLNEYWREWITPEEKKEKVNPFEQI